MIQSTGQPFDQHGAKSATSSPAPATSLPAVGPAKSRVSKGDKGAHKLSGQVKDPLPLSSYNFDDCICQFGQIRSTQTAWTGQRSSPSSLFSFRAYKSYKAAVEAGDDGEPHFHARKACDYLKSAVEVIGSVG